MIDFSKNWKSSKQPKKQRKYRANAPYHIKRKFLSAQLSKELRTKYGRKSAPLRKEDQIIVSRGQFRKTKGKITRVDRINSKVYVDTIQRTKRDGSKTFPPISPSNLMIENMNLDDKKRKLMLEGTKQNVTPKKNSGS